MRREVRRRMEMAARVRAFCLAHPSSAPNQVAVVGRIEELLRRTESLAIAERAGRLEELAAGIRRLELRRHIQFGLLHHLVRVGELAGETNPALAGKFELRTPDGTHRSFLTSVKAMLDLAEANRELLVSLGLTDTLLGDLAAAFTQFQATFSSGRAGRVEHMSARKELEEVSLEAMKAVGFLHGLNRYRFRGKPDLMAAWDSVRVIGPRVRTETGAPPPKGGETPPSGGVAPAA